jgi:hypothetical protein
MACTLTVSIFSNFRWIAALEPRLPKLVDRRVSGAGQRGSGKNALVAANHHDRSSCH